MTTEVNVCIYHGNCADGFGAAFAVWVKHAEECTYVPGKYQEDPPCGFDFLIGKDIVFVDFCYKEDVMEKIIEIANSVTILDHHKTVADTCVNLATKYSDKVTVRFDLNRSGAMIAWQYFNPDEPIPRLFKHIQDRDLWKFELEGTREIQACVFSYPYDFDVWNKLVHRCERNAMDLIKEGQTIERKHFKDIKEFIEATQHTLVIGGVAVPALNAPYMWSSDAGAIMCKNEPFAACYWKVEDRWQFSLRSSGSEGVDVSDIALQYGGGGHKNASGFLIDSLEDL